jgi:hypothetical protein
MSCPSCGAVAAEGARFCSTCGQSLITRSDERRVATVVFADLVGYTSLSESADPEQIKNLVDDCFELLVRDVTSFGGKVDKIVGDAIIALFGAPVAHEDDAERAVRAALRMQETLAAYRAEVDADVPVQVRIGVNTGEVLVGALRAGGDYTAMGDAVNTAQRLQVAALPEAWWWARPPTPPPESHRLPLARTGRGQGPRRAGRGLGRHRDAAAAGSSPRGRRPRSSGARPSSGCSATPSTPPSNASGPTSCC